jgi:hypothetical protein
VENRGAGIKLCPGLESADHRRDNAETGARWIRSGAEEASSNERRNRRRRPVWVRWYKLRVDRRVSRAHFSVRNSEFRVRSSDELRRSCDSRVDRRASGAELGRRFLTGRDSARHAGRIPPQKRNPGHREEGRDRVRRTMRQTWPRLLTLHRCRARQRGRRHSENWRVRRRPVRPSFQREEWQRPRG